MKKHIVLPAQQLSQLKEVDIDLDMSGRHYATLATSQGLIAEDVVLSILKDLVDQDVSQLTIQELRYLFTLVKINSLENDYEVTVSCTHEHNGKVCGKDNTFKVKLSDGDLNPTPKGYKVPKLKFNNGTKIEEYTVMPPTMDMESALLNWITVGLNKSIDDLDKDKELSTNYTFIRGCMHLVDKDGKRLVSKEFANDFSPILNYLDTNNFSTVSKLYDLVMEVNSYGVQNKIYEIKCKECGGTLVFQIPLLYGLVSWQSFS